MGWASPVSAQEWVYPDGALLPLEPTRLVVEQIDVEYDLVAPPSGCAARVRLAAMLANPDGVSRTADLMVLTGSLEPARVQVAGRPVKVTSMMVNLPPRVQMPAGLAVPGEGRVPVSTFPVTVPGQSRSHLVVEFASRGTAGSEAPGSPRFAFRMPAAPPWGGVGGSVVSVRAPLGVRLSATLPLARVQEGVGYARLAAQISAAQGSWFLLGVEPAPLALWLLGLAPPAAASLLAGMVVLGSGSFRSPGRAGVAAALLALGLNLLVAGLLRLSGLPGEGLRPLVDPLLGFLCVGAGPLFAGLAAAAGTRALQ